jgi:hypothetical protein
MEECSKNYPIVIASNSIFEEIIAKGKTSAVISLTEARGQDD